MNLRVLIVDDEPFARERLRQLISEHADVTIVGEAEHAAGAVDFLAMQTPDVMFVDVEMAGCNGVDLVRGLWPCPAVVFSTAHAQYAAEAFDVNAADYLLKPVSSERLRRALTRVRVMIRRRTIAAAGPRHLTRRIAVRSKSEVVFIDTIDILWVAAEGSYSIIHTGAQTYSIRQQLTEFAQRIEGHSIVRIHRSALVNTDKIKKISGTYDNGYTVVLLDDTRVRVGPSYAHVVQELVDLAL